MCPTSIPVLSMLRQTDPWRYPALLFLPKDHRHRLAVLYAFNGEIERIRLLVREPAAGAIRLEWWREVFEGKRKDEAAGNPLAMALLDLIEEFELPREGFIQFIDTRQSQFFESGALPRIELESLLDRTEGFLLETAKRLVGQVDDSDKLIASAGRAMGYVWLLKNMALLTSRRQILMPEELLTAAGLDEQSWLIPPDKHHLAVIEMLISMAQTHFEAAQAAIAKLPKQQRLLFLPLALVPLALKKAERQGKALLTKPLQINPLALQWAYWKAVLRGI